MKFLPVSSPIIIYLMFMATIWENIFFPILQIKELELNKTFKILWLPTWEWNPVSDSRTCLHPLLQRKRGIWWEQIVPKNRNYLYAGSRRFLENCKNVVYSSWLNDVSVKKKKKKPKKLRIIVLLWIILVNFPKTTQIGSCCNYKILSTG